MMNRKLIALMLILGSASALANTVDRDLIISNKSKYDLRALGKITQDIDFILPLFIHQGQSADVEMHFNHGAWYDIKYPQASFNLTVQCPNGKTDVILVHIANSDPVSVIASGLQTHCVNVKQDRQRLMFDHGQQMVRVDIVDK